MPDQPGEGISPVGGAGAGPGRPLPLPCSPITILTAVAWPIHSAFAINGTLAAEACSASDVYVATAPFTTRSGPASTATTDLALVPASNYTPRPSRATRSRCPQSYGSAGIGVPS